MLRLNFAVQKSGRLADGSLSLLARSDISPLPVQGRLCVSCTGFPLDLILLRDDDIPRSIVTGAADLGVVGWNVLNEFLLSDEGSSLKVCKRLGFAKCRLSFAVPRSAAWKGPATLEGKRIATSYPSTVKDFLRERGIKAEIVPMTGSVEIAPELGMADVICDLVSTGQTLTANGLREVFILYESEALLIANREPSRDKALLIDELLRRIVAERESSSIPLRAPEELSFNPRSVLGGLT